MWIFRWICVFFLGGSLAAPDTRSLELSRRVDDSEHHHHHHPQPHHHHHRHTILPRRDQARGACGSGGTRARVVPCAAPCQERFPINTTSSCTHHDVFTAAVTRCVQQACPRLQDLLDWQTHYAYVVCELSARDVAPQDYIASWALFVFATLCVWGRFLARSRWLEGPGFWWDDWLVLALWVLEVETGARLVFLRADCAGRDALAPVDATDVRGMLKWDFISVPFYIIGTYGAKLGWILLYMRM
jgi:hypothetical protein